MFSQLAGILFLLVSSNIFAVETELEKKFKFEYAIYTREKGKGDCKSSYTKMLEFAKAGHPKAMTIVGYCHEETEIPTNKSEAMKWIEKAAVAGDPNGMYNYAIKLFKSSNPTWQDWALKAAEKGVDEGYSMLMVYSYLSLEVLKQAADRGNIMAQEGLIKEYLKLKTDRGEMEAKNLPEALRMISNLKENISDKGFQKDIALFDVCAPYIGKKSILPNIDPKEAALFNESNCENLLFGLDTSMDLPKAKRCYEVGRSKLTLSLMYANGQGGSQDFDSAFNLACSAIDIDHSEMERLSILSALIEKKKNPKLPDLVFCDYATTSMNSANCEYLEARIAGKEIKEKAEKIISSWNEQTKKLFQILKEQSNKFISAQSESTAADYEGGSIQNSIYAQVGKQPLNTSVRFYKEERHFKRQVSLRGWIL